MRCARVIDRTTALGAFLILAVAVGSIASAQIPEAVKQTANQGRSESPPSAELDAKATREGIEKDLARLRERVRIVEAVPVGIKPDEIEAARKSRSMLLFAYEAQLQSLSGIDAHRKARADAERTEQGWPGFKEPAPYSVLLADDLQEQMDIHRSNLALLKSSHGALTVERERFRDRAQAAAETARREAEALERAAPGTDAHALAAWRFAAARDNAASAAELVKLSNFVSREYDEKLALAQTEARFTERKLSAIAGKTAITKADLDEARVRLDKTREQWDRELQTIVAAGSEAAGELDAARKALESLKSQAGDLPSAEQKAQLSLAEARFRSAEIRAESLGQQTRVLSVLATLYTEFVQHAWSHRYAALVLLCHNAW